MKYLFRATFKDGTVIQQTPADVSATDPKKSAYNDVLQAGLNNVAKLELLDDAGNVAASVDMLTGELARFGARFPTPFHPSHTELIYYRQVMQTMTVDGSANSTHTTFVIGYYDKLVEVRQLVEIE